MEQAKIVPVRILGAQVTALEAAVTEVLAAVTPRHVHRLRTSTRRLEATLALLSLLPGLPEHASEAKKVRRRLGKLRRGAGSVRDRDVQIETVKAEGHRGHDEGLQGEIRRLSHQLEQERDREAKYLLKAVTQEQRKLVLQAERLLDVLAPASELEVSETELVPLLREWVADRLGASPRKRSGADGEDRLHDIRKTAKLARYMAESASAAPGELRRLGQEYEALQGTGGQWHDWLTLERLARRVLGASSALAEAFQRECAASLRSYEQALESSVLAPPQGLFGAAQQGASPIRSAPGAASRKLARKLQQPHFPSVL